MDNINNMDKSEYNFDFVDFSKPIKKTNTKNINIQTDNNTNKNNKDTNISKTIVDYDTTTTEHYRILRVYKIDPITNEEIPPHLLFQFKDKWEPLSGERSGNDEVGPLCFNALNLYEYFYKNRYNGLWYPPIDQYQGYYGDIVGSGPNLKINSRGYNPQKYLYRLPIIDCYLSKTHNHSVITMGPKFTPEEIDQIDTIIKKYRTHSVTLKELKTWYDNSLDDKPNITDLKNKHPHLSDRELCEKYNRSWVDKLVKMY